MTSLCIQYLSLSFQVASPHCFLFRAHVPKNPTGSRQFSWCIPPAISTTMLLLCSFPHFLCRNDFSHYSPAFEAVLFYRRCCRKGAAGFSFRLLILSLAQPFEWGIGSHNFTTWLCTLLVPTAPLVHGQTHSNSYVGTCIWLGCTKPQLGYQLFLLQWCYLLAAFASQPYPKLYLHRHKLGPTCNTA